MLLVGYISIWGLNFHLNSPPLSLFSLPFPSTPSLPVPYVLSLSIPFNPAKGIWQHRKLPQRVQNTKILFTGKMVKQKENTNHALVQNWALIFVLKYVLLSSVDDLNSKTYPYSLVKWQEGHPMCQNTLPADEILFANWHRRLLFLNVSSLLWNKKCLYFLIKSNKSLLYFMLLDVAQKCRDI